MRKPGPLDWTAEERSEVIRTGKLPEAIEAPGNPPASNPTDADVRPANPPDFPAAIENIGAAIRDYWRLDGKLEGKREGLDEGLEKGRLEGSEKGRQQGREEVLREKLTEAEAIQAGRDQATLLPPITGTSKEATIAKWLRSIHGAVRPGKSLDEMETGVRQAASKAPGNGLGAFGRPTFKRAVKKAWPGQHSR